MIREARERDGRIDWQASRATYVMTRPVAVQRFGNDVQPVSGSMEVRDLPETYEEQHHSSGWWSDDKKER